MSAPVRQSAVIETGVNVAVLLFDRAAVERQRVCRDGHSVLVAVARGHGVGEGQHTTVSGGGRIGRGAGGVGDGQGQRGGAVRGVHLHSDVEGHLNVDGIARRVGGVAARIADHSQPRDLRHSYTGHGKVVVAVAAAGLGGRDRDFIDALDQFDLVAVGAGIGVRRHDGNRRRAFRRRRHRNRAYRSGVDDRSGIDDLVGVESRVQVHPGHGQGAELGY